MTREHDAQYSDYDGPGHDYDAPQSEHDPKVNPRALAILRAAIDHPAHRRDLLAAACLDPDQANPRRHIAPLVEQGLLAMTIPDAPRSKNQRYRTTEKGRAALTRAESRAGE
ncbi:MAG: hypothetical protein FWD59_10215 [Micrococcales bacterium]|nr:hypothetical protein [Micrococcales bacterium]